jgi:hypothetical protein
VEKVFSLTENIYSHRKKFSQLEKNMSKSGECFSLIENIYSHRKKFSPMNKNKMPQVQNLSLLKDKFVPKERNFFNE